MANFGSTSPARPARRHCDTAGKTHRTPTPCPADRPEFHVVRSARHADNQVAARLARIDRHLAFHLPVPAANAQGVAGMIDIARVDIPIREKLPRIVRDHINALTAVGGRQISQMLVRRGRCVRAHGRFIASARGQQRLLRYLKARCHRSRATFGRIFARARKGRVSGWRGGIAFNHKNARTVMSPRSSNRDAREMISSMQIQSLATVGAGLG